MARAADERAHVACGLVLLVTAGCCIPGKPPAETHNEPIASSTPRPRVQVTQHKYDGAHPIPPFAGGGWHDTKGPHTHPYAPDPAEKYRLENEHHVWTGEPPVVEPE